MTFKFNRDMSFKGDANSRQIRHFPQINKKLKRRKDHTLSEIESKYHSAHDTNFFEKIGQCV